MDKFKIIKNNKQIIKKEKNIMEKEILEKLENEKRELVHFESDKIEAFFTFKCEYEKEYFYINFHLELLGETLIFDYEGSSFTEEMNFIATEINNEILNAIKFMHKDKILALSMYYIANVEKYKERKEETYLINRLNDFKKINNISKIEIMDEAEIDFFEIEEIDDISLYISGEDGKKLGEFLKKEKLIYNFLKKDKNKFEIKFKKTQNYLKDINRKMVFARELSILGYNAWTDYPE